MRKFKADALLLLTAAIWGVAFVAQRMGVEHVGPFTYNGVRFALGSMSLIPLLMLMKKDPNRPAFLDDKSKEGIAVLSGGGLTGFVLFIAASLQQVGIVYTTAGKAGFITGLYVVFVPIVGLFWKQYPRIGTWIGAALAAAGLYFLSITEHLTIEYGDMLVLIGALFWTFHVLMIGWLSPKIGAIRLSFMQFAICSALSLIVAGTVETITLNGLYQAAAPILYGGILSVGIAYTLQVVAQKDAPPSHAAILLSLETVFAAIGGRLILNEQLTSRAFFGCVLMLAGMFISQLFGISRHPTSADRDINPS